MTTTQLAHTRKGSGDPLVLIHGIGHRRQAWDPIFDRLAESYDVIAVDLSGFGESPGYPDGVSCTMDHACRNLAENFAEWGIERPHVVGNSLGGAIALELGARGLASSVTALSPAGFFRGPDRAVALLGLLLLKLTSHLPIAVVRPALRTATGRLLVGRLLYEHGDRVTPEAFVADTLALRGGSAFFPTLRAGLRYSFDASVPVATTVAWATRDKILLHGQSAVARAALPDARHVDLPQCGHVPMVDDPALIVRIIDLTIEGAGSPQD